MGAKQSSEMTKVKKLVVDQGYTPCAAVKKVGNITRNAVYMSAWYREWKIAKPEDTTTK